MVGGLVVMLYGFPFMMDWVKQGGLGYYPLFHLEVIGVVV